MGGEGEQLRGCLPSWDQLASEPKINEHTGIWVKETDPLEDET